MHCLSSPVNHEGIPQFFFPAFLLFDWINDSPSFLIREVSFILDSVEFLQSKDDFTSCSISVRFSSSAGLLVRIQTLS